MAWIRIFKPWDVRKLNRNSHSNSNFEKVVEAFGGMLSTNNRSVAEVGAEPMRLGDST